MTSRRSIPVACTLDRDKAQDQLAEWVELQRQATDVAEIDSGIRMTLPGHLHEQIADLAQREATCCAFLALSVSKADGQVILDIISDNHDARPVIAALGGTQS